MAERYAVYEVSDRSGRLVHYRVTEPLYDAANVALKHWNIVRCEPAYTKRRFVVGTYPFTHEVDADEVQRMVERKHAEELALWRQLQ